jgi:hypothetical protein
MKAGILFTLVSIAIASAALPAQEPPSPRDPESWFQQPCLGDSIDSFEWTRYDLHGIRIRIPRDARHVKHPSLDELHFALGGARMIMRLHRDASQLFAQQWRPSLTRRYCAGELGGLLAEAISMGGGTWYGFAARWADADRGEWLAVVISGSRYEDVTALRKTVFTLLFPGEQSR